MYRPLECCGISLIVFSSQNIYLNKQKKKKDDDDDDDAMAEKICVRVRPGFTTNVTPRRITS